MFFVALLTDCLSVVIVVLDNVDIHVLHIKFVPRGAFLFRSERSPA